MEQYNLNNAKYGTHNLIAEEIGRGKSVLDVGCNKGYLMLLAKENDFYGIDFDEIDLAGAREAGYQEVFKINLNNYANFATNRKFDLIVFADILEHLLSPEKVLEFFRTNYLKKEGRVIISFPNVANISVRLRLLFGNFDYVESGILDRTHLHLYTLKTARNFIESGGLKIIQEKFSSNRFGRLIAVFPFLSRILAYNLIFICQEK